MSDIRKSLESLADSIEKIQNQPAPKPKILDRELSGNKINGGVITNFSSVGIKDNAGDVVLYVQNDGISVDTIYTKQIKNDISIKGNIDVKGEIKAEKLHVNEITSDIRHQKESPLEFKGEKSPNYDTGLIWTGGPYAKQFVLKKPDRFWSTESIDLHRDSDYRINNKPVLTSNSLGGEIIYSNLRTVGTLKKLGVSGELNINDELFYDPSTQMLSLGTDSPVGQLTLSNLDQVFVIDGSKEQTYKIGSYTTAGIDIVTDDTTRISIDPAGKTSFKNTVRFEGSIGIAVKNPLDDVKLTIGGPIRFQNKKQEVCSEIPENGNYTKGDIVWNSEPKPTGFVGWVCVREGTPGEWKGFGQISA